MIIIFYNPAAPDVHSGVKVDMRNQILDIDTDKQSTRKIFIVIDLSQ